MKIDRKMKRLIYSVALFIAFSPSLFSQNQQTAKKATSNAITVTRNVPEFQSIQINGRFLVKLYNSTKSEVKIVALEEYIPKVETVVENGFLSVRMADNAKNENANFFEGLKAKYGDFLVRQPIEIQIGVPDVKNIKVNGVTTVQTDSPLKLQKLNLEIGDATKANLNLELEDEFIATVSGASKMQVSGKTQNLQVYVNGASSYEGSDLSAQNVKVVLTGASRAELQALNSIDATLKGATKLVCTGSPKQIKQEASVGSSISIK
jgi:hypothetical protein